MMFLLLASSLRLALRAALHAFKIAPGDFVISARLRLKRLLLVLAA
jgi:hypothetical protein